MNARRLSQIEVGAPPTTAEHLFCLSFTLAGFGMFAGLMLCVIVDAMKYF